MGIGNEHRGERRRKASNTHYPSWGLETTVVTVDFFITRLSLPLTGIGNSTARGGSPPHPELITPHGDWKPGGGTAQPWTFSCSLPLMGIGNSFWCVRTPASAHHSLPLMGIGNSIQSTCTRALWYSLPLMGIGNDRRSPILRPARSTHYPSWGLETWTVVLDMPDGSSSLPLMGIGNRPGALWGLDAFKLITPHGDWKPQDAVLPDEWDRISLPLMGIGNPFAFAATSSVCVSLPLMGIGNFKHASLNLLQSVLITPHGDWKRPDRCGRSPA